MLASLVIAGLFAWGYFAGTGELNQRLVVPMLPGIAAFATFTIVLISYFAIPLPRLMASAVINYALFLARIAVECGIILASLIGRFNNAAVAANAISAYHIQS